MKHVNNGQCEYCLSIINRYPGFNENLKSWFVEFQKLHPEMHCSSAGRGKIDQEVFFQRGASRAHYGESSHNWNCGVDVFVIIKGENSLYPTSWFNNILSPGLPSFIEWYGKKGSKYFEFPHLEIKGWKEMAKKGILKLVE